MKAGEYYIGDICYVLHEVWDEVCDLIIDDKECLEGEFVLSDGRKFACYNTYWGDGEYNDQRGRRYLVDAGIIGCILKSEVNLDVRGNDLKGGNIETFHNDFNTYNNKGYIHIGHVKINTYSDADNYDEEEEYEESNY